MKVAYLSSSGMHMPAETLTLLFLSSTVSMLIKKTEQCSQYTLRKKELVSETNLMPLWIIVGMVSTLARRDFKDSSVLLKLPRDLSSISNIPEHQPRLKDSLLKIKTQSWVLQLEFTSQTQMPDNLSREERSSTSTHGMTLPSSTEKFSRDSAERTDSSVSRMTWNSTSQLNNHVFLN